MFRNCLSACVHLTITVSEIERDIGRKSSFFHTPLHSTPPLGGSRRNSATLFGTEKTKIVCLPDGEKNSKIFLFVLAQLTNVTDRRTDNRHRMPAIASIARQKPQSYGPLYCNTVWLLRWPTPLMGGLLHLVQRAGAWAVCGSAQSPPRCTKCYSPPINGQCTIFILFDVVL